MHMVEGQKTPNWASQQMVQISKLFPRGLHLGLFRYIGPFKGVNLP